METPEIHAANLIYISPGKTMILPVCNLMCALGLLYCVPFQWHCSTKVILIHAKNLRLFSLRPSRAPSKNLLNQILNPFAYNVLLVCTHHCTNYDLNLRTRMHRHHSYGLKR